jgi:hypothetical protein
MKRAIDTWSDYEKRTRDPLDRQVAQILLIDDQGNVITPDNLTEQQIKILDRWEAQVNDQAFMATEWVRAKRKERHERKWYQFTETTKLGITLAIWLGLIAAIDHSFNGKDIDQITLGIFLILYVVGSAVIVIWEWLEKKEEDQIFREWNIHVKLNRINEELFERRAGK